MQLKDRALAHTIYLILSAVFIASLVTSNLIFQKFFRWDIMPMLTFELSVGILPYPVTFLVTDIISEVYGKKQANRVVLAGLFASSFTLLIISAANYAEATAWSPVSNKEFNHVFGLTFAAVSSSMIAYLIAQLIDVQIYHFWKRLTHGKHLWLRNNGSTLISQTVDTAVVLLILCSLKIIDWSKFTTLLGYGVLFKSSIALTDTPLIYLFSWIFRKKFHLKNIGDEIVL